MKKLFFDCKEMTKRIPFSLVMIYLLGITFVLLHIKNYL